MKNILEFTTQSLAEQSLDTINSIASTWWQSKGYTVDNGELIGKNALSGADEPLKQRTTTWSVPQESPEGTWYIESLSNDIRFYDPNNGVDWKPLYVNAGGPLYIEKEIPIEWIDIEAEAG